MLTSTFATDLVDARKRAQLSQSKVAHHLGVNRVTYNRWENGRCLPSPGTLKKLANLFPDVALPPVPAVDFPSTLKNARIKAGYTQEQLANRIGATRDSVCNWETGYTQPRPENIEVLEFQLGVRLRAGADVERGATENDKGVLDRHKAHQLVDAVFDKLTVDQAHAWLDNCFSAARTANEAAKALLVAE